MDESYMVDKQHLFQGGTVISSLLWLLPLHELEFQSVSVSANVLKCCTACLLYISFHYFQLFPVILSSTTPLCFRLDSHSWSLNDWLESSCLFCNQHCFPKLDTSSNPIHLEFVVFPIDFSLFYWFIFFSFPLCIYSEAELKLCIRKKLVKFLVNLS